MFASYDDLQNAVRASMPARIVLTAVELNVADVLAKGGEEGLEASEVAAALSADERAMGMFLDAISSLGLAIKSGDKYKNSPMAADKLVTTSPNYGGDGFWHMVQLWKTWSQLTDCVLKGKPAEVGERTEEQYHQFVGAMYDYGFSRAQALAKSISLSGAKRLIDVGGGPGSYAICFCAENKGLEATVFDRPLAIKVALEKIEKHGMLDRVKVTRGDFLEDPLGKEYDVAFGSHIIHAYGPEDSKTFLKKCYDALVPGGLFLLQDFFAQDDKVTPPNVPVFALNMLVNTPKGQTYTFSETIKWLQEAGFKDVKTLDTPPGADVISARK